MKAVLSISLSGSIGSASTKCEMVMRISAWGQKLSSKAMAMGQYTPDMFVKSQWQKTTAVSVYYLLYRWLIACVFLSILLVSLLEIGRPGKDVAHYAKWAIYLTHWGFLLCTLQALLAAYLVTRSRCQHPEKEVEAMKMNPCLRVYWVLHTCATVGAFAITVIYWCFVYNPAENKLDTLNLLVHAGNSVLMLTDLFLVSHPVRLIDFYWPISFAVVYVIFNYIYYEAGGTDRKGRRYIYGIMNWQEPVRALITAQMCIVFVLVLHVSVCVFSLLRCKLSQRCRRHQADLAESRARNLQGVTNEIPIDDFV